MVNYNGRLEERKMTIVFDLGTSPGGEVRNWDSFNNSLV